MTSGGQRSKDTWSPEALERLKNRMIEKIKNHKYYDINESKRKNLEKIRDGHPRY